MGIRLVKLITGNFVKKERLIPKFPLGEIRSCCYSDVHEKKQPN